MKGRLHALRIGVTILALVSLRTAAAAGTYTVRNGDTLWDIAKRFHVPITDIKRASQVSANRPLQIGTKLTIPGKDQPQCQKQSSQAEQPITRQTIVRFGARLAQRIADEAQAAQCKDRRLFEIARAALAYRGARYRRGGTTARGFDCSGFTRHVYARFGIRLPHSSSAQASCGRLVARHDLQPGDLVFFHTRRRGISHVGIYVGNQKFIHASTPRRGVVVNSLSERYYVKRFRGARRVAPKARLQS